MGSATSAEAKKKQRREERQQKREIKKQRKREAILSNPSDYDEDGTQYFLDETGEKYYVDEDLVPFYLDQEGRKYYYDKNRHKFYLDERQRPYHVDKYGERCHWDKKGNPFYIAEDGVMFYLDYNRKKYYLDEEGVPFYFDKSGNVCWIGLHCIDDKGRVISRKRSRKTLKTNTAEAHHIGYTGIDVVPSFGETIGQDIANPDEDSSKESTDSTESDNTIGGIGAPSSPMVLSKTADSLKTKTAKSKQISSSNEAKVIEDGLSLERYRTLTPEFSKYPDIPDEEDVTFNDIAQANTDADRKVLNRILDNEKEKEILPIRKRYRIIGHYFVKQKTDTNDCSINGSAFLPNGNLVISDFHNRNLKMYDPDLKFISDFNLNAYPENMCARALDFDVYVPFKSGVEYGIKVVKVTDKTLSLKKTLKTKGQCYGICSNNGGLAVIVNTAHGWQVHLLDLNGRIKRQIVMEIDDKPILKRPDYLSVTSDLQLLISDRALNSVFCFDVRTETLVFTHSDIREPYGATCDNKRSIFVTSPGGVHQISSTGEHVAALMNRKEIGFSPTCACYDLDDSLLVLTGQSNKMVAFQLIEAYHREDL